MLNDTQKRLQGLTSILTDKVNTPTILPEETVQNLYVLTTGKFMFLKAQSSECLRSFKGEEFPRCRRNERGLDEVQFRFLDDWNEAINRFV
jgi:hypothetical protein